jgi:hypothetical protein
MFFKRENLKVVVLWFFIVRYIVRGSTYFFELTNCFLFAKRFKIHSKFEIKSYIISIVLGPLRDLNNEDFRRSHYFV